jgi:orotate phosphoribosyltransferase
MSVKHAIEAVNAEGFSVAGVVCVIDKETNQLNKFWSVQTF